MRDPDQFDTFYKDARDRLLVQTFCFTGDLPAARHAVRDAFVVAWHRWRKVSRVSDPESVVRPDAWRIAQRRHTARVWHREKDLDDEVRATLDALGKLSVNQRKAVLLTQLASVSMPQMAREIGVPLEKAEQELQAGVAQLSLARDVPSYAVPTLLEPVAAAALADTRWPRATIVRRAGATRRRTHTLVGVAGAVAAVLVTGALVTDATGVRATLDRVADPGSGGGSGAPAMQAEPAMALPDTSLLDAGALDARFDGRRWNEGATTDNSDGTGRAVPCQADRYADPRGDAALVRSSIAAPAPGRPELRVTQLTEVSPGPRAATRAYATAAGWFGACAEPSVQLVDTTTPTGVGDEAVHLVLRSAGGRQPETWLVGVARTGLFTTTTFLRVSGSGGPDAERSPALLRDAVGRLCGLEGAGASCRAPAADAEPVRLAARDPLPAGPVPAMLSEIDLTPVPGVRRPWVGTEARRPQPGSTTTPCGPPPIQGRFKGVAFTRAATRTFVVPEARLPEEFGLTQTVAALPRKAAGGFVDQVRARFGSCADRELGTDVDEVASTTRGTRALSVWRLEVRVTEQRSIPYWVAVVRDGTAVGQLDLVPAQVGIGEREVVALAERALERLGSLPGPGS